MFKTLVLVIGVFASAWDEKRPGCGSSEYVQADSPVSPGRFQGSQPCGSRPSSESQVQWHKIREDTPCGERGHRLCVQLALASAPPYQSPLHPKPYPGQLPASHKAQNAIQTQELPLLRPLVV